MNRILFSIATLLGALMPLIFDSALKGAALLAVAALTALVLYKASAATRHLVWLVAVVALLIVPVLSFALPQWRVLPKWATAPVVEPAPAPATVKAATTERTSSPPSIAALPPATATPVPASDPAPAGMPLQQRAQSPVSPLPSQETPRTWRDWLPLAWCAGFALLTLRLLAAHLLLRRASQNCPALTSPPDEKIAGAFAEACRQLGLRQRVTLLLDKRRTIPVVWGVLRPRLMLPIEARGWTDDQLRSVLLHELAHIKRRDTLVQWLTQIACALHWWNPLVWLAAWRLHAERERACDDLVLASGVRPSAYAEHLLHVATKLSPARWTAACGLAMARKSSLEGRLLAVLSEKLNRRGVTSALAAIALILGAGIAVPVAMLRAADEKWNPPQAAHIGGNDFSAYCVHDGKDAAFVIAYHGETGSSSAHDSNSKTRTWTDSGTFTAKKPGIALGFHRTHTAPGKLSITTAPAKGRDLSKPAPAPRDFGQKEYDLAKGRVFLLTDTGLVRQFDLPTPVVTDQESKKKLATLIAAIPPQVREDVAPPRNFTGKLAPESVAKLKWGEPVNGLRMALAWPPALDDAFLGNTDYFQLVVQNVSENPIHFVTGDDAPNPRKMFYREGERIVQSLSDNDAQKADRRIAPGECGVLRLFSKEERGKDGKTISTLIEGDLAGSTRYHAIAIMEVAKAPVGAWTGKLTSGQTRGSADKADAPAPKHKDARALYEIWQRHARGNGDIPGALVGELAAAVRQFIKYNPTWETVPKLKTLHPRLDATRDWKSADAIALLDEVAAVQDSPLDSAAEKVGRHTIRKGEKLPEKFADVEWMGATGGLLAAWVLEPDGAEHRIGTALKARLLVWNPGAVPVMLQVPTWHQGAVKASDAKGAEVEVSGIFWTTLAQLFPCRLGPGEYIEINTPGVGLGPRAGNGPWAGPRVGSNVLAKPGDELTLTHGPVPLDGSGVGRREDDPHVAGAGWWLAHIKARLARELPLPADATERARLLERAVRELFGVAPTAEETAAFVADKTPGAFDTLVKHLASRVDVVPFSGTLQTAPAKFRVLAADADADNLPRVVLGPGEYPVCTTEQMNVTLKIVGRPVGERRTNDAELRFLTDGQQGPAPHKLTLPDGWGTWAIVCRPGEGCFYVLQKGGVRKIDFSNPAKVADAPANDLPAAFRDEAKRQLEILGVSAEQQAEIFEKPAPPAATPAPDAAAKPVEKDGPRSNEARLQPKHEYAQSLFRKWQASARTDGKIPGALIEHVAREVEGFLKQHPGDDKAPQLAALRPRLDASRDWTQAEVVALLDDITAIATAPVSWADIPMEFSSMRSVKGGQPLPIELESVAWGQPVANGLRAAWLLEPRAEQYALGSVLKARVLFHNTGKAPVVFKTETWHQYDGHTARDAKGAEIKIGGMRYTGITPMATFRLAPGEYCEVMGHGIAIGAGKYEEEYSIGSVGAVIEAKEGDAVTLTHTVDAAEGGWTRPNDPKDPAELWKATIAERVANEAPMPASTADRAQLIRRVTLDMLGVVPTAEEVAAFTADNAPDALAKLTARLQAKPRVEPFSGKLPTGETKFRVIAADPNAAKAPRTASRPGRYVLGDGAHLLVSQTTEGHDSKRTNKATIAFLSPDPKKESPHKPHEIALPNGLASYAFAWDRGSGKLWLVTKGVVRSYDFTNPAQVQETRYEPGSIINIPQHLHEPLKEARTFLGGPVQVPKKPKGADVKTASTEGKYDLGGRAHLSVERVTGQDGKPVSNMTAILTFGSAALPGSTIETDFDPHFIELGSGLFRFVWEHGAGVLWLVQQGSVTKIDFTNRQKVKEGTIAPERMNELPEAVKEARDSVGEPVQKPAAPAVEKPKGAAAKLTPDALLGTWRGKTGGKNLALSFQRSPGEKAVRFHIFEDDATIGAPARYTIADDGGSAMVVLEFAGSATYGTLYPGEAGTLRLRLTRDEERGPDASIVLTRDANEPQQATVGVAKDGSLRWNGKPLTLDELKAVAAREPGRQFVIRADKDTPFAKVTAVMEALKGAGATKVGIAAVEEMVKLTPDALLGTWRGKSGDKNLMLSFHHPPVDESVRLDIYEGDATIGMPAVFDIAKDGGSALVTLQFADSATYGTLRPGEKGTLRLTLTRDEERVPDARIVLTRDAEAPAPAKEPRQAEARELFDMWKRTANDDGTIPGTFIGKLATEVRAYVKAHPNYDSAMKLPKLLPRFVTSRDWTQAEAIKLLDDVAYYSPAPIAARVAKAKLPSGPLWRTEVEFADIPVQIANWSEAKDGLRIGMRVVEGKWRIGGKVRAELWLHNAGGKDVTFKSTGPDRQDVGLIVSALDAEGREHWADNGNVNIIAIPLDGALPAGHVAMAKKFEVTFAEPDNDVKTWMAPRFRDLKPGKYQLRCKWTDAHPSISSAGDWKGELTAPEHAFTLAASVAATAEAKPAPKLAKLPDDSYAKVGVPMGEFNAGAVNWSAEQDGLCLAMSVAEDAEWRIGGETKVTLWVCNPGEVDVKFQHCARRDIGLRVLMKGADGRERAADITQFRGRPVALPVLLPAGHIFKAKEFSVVFLPPGGKAAGADPHFTLAAGGYKFRSELKLPGLTGAGADGKQRTPAEGEWTGTLKSGEVEVKLLAAANAKAAEPAEDNHHTPRARMRDEWSATFLAHCKTVAESRGLKDWKPDDVIAWGPEGNGLRSGLVMQQRAAPGGRQPTWLVLRNFSKEPKTMSLVWSWNATDVVARDASGKALTVRNLELFGIDAIHAVTLKPDEQIEMPGPPLEFGGAKGKDMACRVETEPGKVLLKFDLTNLPGPETGEIAITVAVADGVKQGGADVKPEKKHFWNDKYAAVAVQSEKDVNFVLVYPGFISTGMSESFSGSGADARWSFEGNVHLVDTEKTKAAGRNVDKRKIAVKYTSDAPTKLFLDGKAYDLATPARATAMGALQMPGRIFILRDEGEPIQTNRTLALRSEKDLATIGEFAVHDRFMAETYANNRRVLKMEGWALAWDTQDPIQHGVGSPGTELEFAL